MATTANDRIRDALIRHQVNLQRLSAGLSAELVGVLDRTETQIRRELLVALSEGAALDTSRSLRKMQALEDVIREIRASAFTDIAQRLDDSMVDLVRHEAEFTALTLDVESPTVLDTLVPAPATLTALVSEAPFEGHLLKEWMDKLADGDARRVIDGVRVGMTRGLSTQDIVRLVLGSTEFDGSDGTTQLTRNQTVSLVRTSVNAYANMARQATFDENADLIDFEMYHATLDARTTPICRSLDGQIFKRGEGPVPPQHFGCRSLRVAILGGEAVGTRPLKASTEKQLVHEFGAENDFTGSSRKDIPRGLKGKFDEFSRRRVRELTGSAPGDTTYSQFLSRQSVEFQNEVLGVTKARLFRDGGLTLDKFVTRQGTELTLVQLAKKERAAFRKAGVDPDKFKDPA